MSYRTRIPLTFVVGGGPDTVVCPAGTTMEPLPEGSLSYAEATHYHRMLRVQAANNPSARLVPVRWDGKMRVLTIGEHLVPARRTLSVGIVPERR